MTLSIFKEDQDEYTYQEQDDDEYDDQIAFDDLADYRESSTSNGRRAATGKRRSTRTSNASSTARRNTVDDEWGDWRGERRSTRLGASAEAPKNNSHARRARTAESSNSVTSGEGQPLNSHAPANPALKKLKINGAAAIKPTETVVETVAGKKKSKFWYYAVEPVSETNGNTRPPPANPPPLNVDDASSSSTGVGSTTNGNGNHHESGGMNGSEYSSDVVMSTDVEVPERSLEDPSSPSRSMDET